MAQRKKNHRRTRRKFTGTGARAWLEVLSALLWGNVRVDGVPRTTPSTKPGWSSKRWLSVSSARMRHMDLKDFDLIIDLAARYAAKHPEATAADLVVFLNEARTTQVRMRRARSDKCRHCGRPVVLEGDRWMHQMPNAEETSCRGCRAASFDWNDGEWDDSLAERLKATPISY